MGLFPGAPRRVVVGRGRVATVLVADDSMFVREMITALARSLGHDVINAANGVEAVARFEELRPDVVLLDITMPEMDGLEALCRIRSIDPEARVAMVTALGSQQVVMEALKSGASEFLLKPVGRKSLAEAIDRLVG